MLSAKTPNEMYIIADWLKDNGLDEHTRNKILERVPQIHMMRYSHGIKEMATYINNIPHGCFIRRNAGEVMVFDIGTIINGIEHQCVSLNYNCYDKKPLYVYVMCGDGLLNDLQLEEKLLPNILKPLSVVTFREIIQIIDTAGYLRHFPVFESAWRRPDISQFKWIPCDNISFVQHMRLLFPQ